MSADAYRLAAEFRGASDAAQITAGRVVEETAMDVVSLARQLAPVDTGTLRRSIHHEMLDDGGGYRNEAEVGTDVEYGPHQEYGTSVMPPAPFLGPALDEMMPTFVERLRQIGLR